MFLSHENNFRQQYGLVGGEHTHTKTYRHIQNRYYETQFSMESGIASTRFTVFARWFFFPIHRHSKFGMNVATLWFNAKSISFLNWNSSVESKSKHIRLKLPHYRRISRWIDWANLIIQIKFAQKMENTLNKCLYAMNFRICCRNIFNSKTTMNERTSSMLCEAYVLVLFAVRHTSERWKFWQITNFKSKE